MQIWPRPKGSYWSCQWLEGGLAFAPNNLVTVCCIMHHGKGGMPVLLPDFTEDEIPLEIVLRRRTWVRRKNQDVHDRFPACDGCPLLVKKRWLPRRYWFDTFDFGHFTMCNLKCVFCHTQWEGREQKTERPNLYTAIKGLIEAGHVSPRTRVGWGGGEVSILPEFDKLFRLIHALGSSYQFVNSNGVVLSPALMDALPTRRCHLILSIDAATPETYYHMKGVDAFQRVWKNAAEYARAGKERVFAKMIITERNKGEAVEFARLAQEAGIRMVFADLDSWNPALDEDIVEAGALLAEECRRRGIWFSAKGRAGALAHPEKQWDRRVASAYRRNMRNRSLSARIAQLAGAARQTTRLISYGLSRVRV